MKFEVLKRSHVKRNILLSIVVVLILCVIILQFTRAKYRVTESVPLVTGTINFSPYDFNVIAMYLNKNGESISTDKAPHVGYTLNTDQSICEVNDEKDENVEIQFEEGNLYFNKMNYKGTKCSVYFDLIPDSEKPTLNIVTPSSDTSITVVANATDNIGIYYYYFKLDNGEEIRIENNTYTFDGLQKGDVHTISVRVEDAAGNEVSASEKVTVGYRAADVILAHYPTVLTRNDFSITVPNITTGTIYKSLDENQYDNDGEVYYFAGNPTDNWVQFGTNSNGQPLFWRIIRINGDESVRLIYNGTTTDNLGSETQIGTSAFNAEKGDNMYAGYMYQSGQVHGLQNNSTIKIMLDEWYSNNLVSYAEYLDGNAGFCGDRTPYSGTGIGTTSTNYAAYNRFVINQSPTFKCTNVSDLYTTTNSKNGNKALIFPIGLITADEVAFAGGERMISNKSYYLYTGNHYWTLTPNQAGHGSIYVCLVNVEGSFNEQAISADGSLGVRPVINLRADVELTGSGTTTDPYVVVS